MAQIEGLTRLTQKKSLAQYFMFKLEHVLLTCWIGVRISEDLRTGMKPFLDGWILVWSLGDMISSICIS
jgi:hypothetical protein